MLQAVGPGRSDIACVNGDAVAGRQLRYAAPDRPGGRDILISEIGGERVAVHLRPKAGAGHDRLQLRREDQPSAAQAVIERPLAEPGPRWEEHTSELQSLMGSPYAVLCSKK